MQLRLVFALAVLFSSAIQGFAQEVARDSAGNEPTPSIRIVLFTPSDVAIPSGARERLTNIADAAEKFFFTWMNHWGYPPAVKALFRREPDGLVEVLNVRGDLPVASGKYAKPDFAPDVSERATRQYHVAGKGHVWWIFIYVGDRPVRFQNWAGTGDSRDGGWAMVNYDTIPGEIRPDLGLDHGFNREYFLKGTIHELGHALGLHHTGPNLALGLGNPLMGPNFDVYAARGYPGDAVFLSESSAAMLWKHPIFSGAVSGRLGALKLKLIDYNPVFNRTHDSLTISGKLVADQPAHSVILLDDRGRGEHPGDQYFFPSYASRIGPGGAFRIRIDKPARASGHHWILFCFDNGLVTGDGAHITFDNRGAIQKFYAFRNGDFQFADSRAALPKAAPIPAGLKFASPFRDDFDGRLEPGWQWIDPKGDSTKSLDVRRGFLRIAVQGYHDLWTSSGNFNAPRLMREVDGDFTIETKLAGPGRWRGGLLVWKDQGNFVRLDRGTLFRNEIGLEAAVEAEFKVVAHEYVEADPVWLRLERAGSMFTAAYKLDGKQWSPLKRMVTGLKKDVPNVSEDALSLLKEQDFVFQDAPTSVEMSAPVPLLVGITGLSSGMQTATDYDYFAIKGK